MNVHGVNENGSFAKRGGWGAHDRVVEDEGNEFESDEDEMYEGDHTDYQQEVIPKTPEEPAKTTEDAKSKTEVQEKPTNDHKTNNNS